MLRAIYCVGNDDDAPREPTSLAAVRAHSVADHVRQGERRSAAAIAFVSPICSSLSFSVGGACAARQDRADGAVVGERTLRRRRCLLDTAQRRRRCFATHCAIGNEKNFEEHLMTKKKRDNPVEQERREQKLRDAKKVICVAPFDNER